MPLYYTTTTPKKLHECTLRGAGDRQRVLPQRGARCENGVLLVRRHVRIRVVQARVGAVVSAQRGRARGFRGFAHEHGVLRAKGQAGGGKGQDAVAVERGHRDSCIH